MSCFGVSKKPKVQPYFGVPLEQAVNHPNNVSDTLPYPIWHLLQYLETEKGFHCSGLYRIPGSALEINQIQKIYDTGGEPKLAKYGISPCASLLKKYFKMLPDPLLSYAEFHNFMNAVDDPDEKSRVQKIRQSVLRTPKVNQGVLKRIIRHLRNVAAYSHINKMTISNLSIVFAPTLMRAKNETMVQLLKNTPKMTTIVHHFIQDYNTIFETKKKKRHKKRMSVELLKDDIEKVKSGGSDDDDSGDEKETKKKQPNGKKTPNQSKKPLPNQPKDEKPDEEYDDEEDDEEEDELVMISLSRPMYSLSKRIRFFRNKAGRPEAPKEMSFTELRLEKKLIKKELKSFDQVYKYKNGCLPTKRDKEPLRPLYNRYRMVKKQIDSLASENEERKKNMVKRREMKKKRKERERERMAEMRKRQEERRETEGMARGTVSRLTNDKSVQQILMRSEKFLGFLKEKRVLQKKLHEFQKKFEKENGKKIATLEDRKPMEREYLRYKEVKVEMARLAEKVKKQVTGS